VQQWRRLCQVVFPKALVQPRFDVGWRESWTRPHRCCTKFIIIGPITSVTSALNPGFKWWDVQHDVKYARFLCLVCCRFFCCANRPPTRFLQMSAASTLPACPQRPLYTRLGRRHERIGTKWISFSCQSPCVWSAFSLFELMQAHWNVSKARVLDSTVYYRHVFKHVLQYASPLAPLLFLSYSADVVISLIWLSH